MQNATTDHTQQARDLIARRPAYGTTQAVAANNAARERLIDAMERAGRHADAARLRAAMGATA